MHTVLIVDDDRDIREALEEMLRLEGFAPTCAADGYDALHLIRMGADPSAILLDLMMPVMSGEQFFRLLPPAMRNRCIVMTAGVPTAFAPIPILRKPFEMDDLIDTLHAVCGGAAKSPA